MPTAPPQRRRAPSWRPASALPGFRLTFGFTMAYLGLLVLVPLLALMVRPIEMGIDRFWQVATQPHTLASLGLSFGAAAVGAAINGVFGLAAAWVLVRYRFPGRGVLDGLIDLPFAMPTAVAGVALAGLYAPPGLMNDLLDGLGLGRPFGPDGLQVAYSQLGVFVALTFIGLPFVVRMVEPVLADLEADLEEAAATLGAGRLQTIARVLLPALLPAWLTGVTLAFARAVGEYGSVIFISSNVPGESEIAPLRIVKQLEAYDYAEAAAIGVIMVAASFLLLLAINLLQLWAARRGARL